jgi:hypothetical protein
MISRRIPWYRDAAMDVRQALGLVGLPREPLRFESISPESLCGLAPSSSNKRRTV